MRNLLNAHSKTSTEALYIETGAVPLRFIIQSRRLLYWKHLISINKERLISKVYNAQKYSPAKGDWSFSLNNDKEQFGINNSEEEIRRMSKYKFKKIVKTKMKELAKKYLLKLKNKHSKMEKIEFNKIGCKTYLNHSRISPSEAKLLFKLRTRMYPVKENFKNKMKKYGQNLHCEICKTEEDTQKRILQCHVLKTVIPELKTTKVKYEDIFGNINKMVKAVKLF